jgi:hypothetical protein
VFHSCGPVLKSGCSKIHVRKLRFYDPLSCIDPFRQSATQGRARRRRIVQVLVNARNLQRPLLLGMADANPGQPPKNFIAYSWKLRYRLFHAVEVDLIVEWPGFTRSKSF